MHDYRAHTDETNRQTDPSAGYEVRDFGLRTIVVWGIGLFGFVGATMAFTIGLYSFLVPRGAEVSGATRLPDTQWAPPEPRLQANPARDMEEFRAVENAVLGSYGWVDRDGGVVRIPIDQAIAITAERGLAARGAAPAAPAPTPAETVAPAEPAPGPAEPVLTEPVLTPGTPTPAPAPPAGTPALPPDTPVQSPAAPAPGGEGEVVP